MIEPGADFAADKQSEQRAREAACAVL